MQSAKHKTICVNLTGSPSAGKSTLAALVFAKMKIAGINCELVTEYAKEKVWEENKHALENQLYILAHQHYRIVSCAKKVDVVITDSPLFLSAFYNKDTEIDSALRNIISVLIQRYDNLNYFVKRVVPYNPVGRIHTEEESDRFAIEIQDLLKSFGISFKTIDCLQSSADIILNDVKQKLA